MRAGTPFFLGRGRACAVLECSAASERWTAQARPLQMGWFAVVLLFAVTAPSLPAADPPTAAALGEKLFFDPILSRDRSVSCASCHKPEHAFADNVALSPG